MHSWVFRHRHQLRAIYGLAPEPRVQALLDAERSVDADLTQDESPEAGTLRRVEPAGSDGELPEVELRPRFKRA